MSALALFFADLPDDFAPRKFSLGSSSRELVLVIGAVILVSSLALIWALFLRKKPRRHHHSHQHSTPKAASSSTIQANSESETKEGSRRRRRRRRKELPRNPTLAETGGLPPIRGEGPSEPPH